MQFCFLARIVSFQRVAQNLSSRLKRVIESRTQQHITLQFSSLEEKVSYVYETNSRFACRNFRPSRISTAHNSMPQTQGCVRYSLACEQALYSGGNATWIIFLRELFSSRAPKARVSASEASPRWKLRDSRFSPRARFARLHFVRRNSRLRRSQRK